jgi:hypothetical protein
MFNASVSKTEPVKSPFGLFLKPQGKSLPLKCVFSASLPHAASRTESGQNPPPTLASIPTSSKQCALLEHPQLGIEFLFLSEA